MIIYLYLKYINIIHILYKFVLLRLNKKRHFAKDWNIASEEGYFTLNLFISENPICDKLFVYSTQFKIKSCNNCY